ncbi:hypothetical protein AB0N17_01365 [Streptomyces sp. NPDC051133]|uniref:hypothetical protein n=1 Tax=Streptomyces sp. NPDC051133 TaxID=3155521 RepID=UPI00342CB798
MAPGDDRAATISDAECPDQPAQTPVSPGCGRAAQVVASRLIDRRPGVVTEAYTTGRPHRLRRAAEYLTLGGAVTAMNLARRSRVAAAVGGLALLAGSVLQRFGTFEAGVRSTKDPAYVVKPQRERLQSRLGGVNEDCPRCSHGRDRFGWMALEPLALSVQKREVVTR